MASNLGVATTHIVATVLTGPNHSTRANGPRSIFQSRKPVLHLKKEVKLPLVNCGPLGHLLVCTGPLLHREEPVLPVTRHIQVKLGVVSHDVDALSSELR